METSFTPLTPEEERSLDKALGLGEFNPRLRDTVSRVKSKTPPRSRPINVALLCLAGWNIGRRKR